MTNAAHPDISVDSVLAPSQPPTDSSLSQLPLDSSVITLSQLPMANSEPMDNALSQLPSDNSEVTATATHSVHLDHTDPALLHSEDTAPLAKIPSDTEASWEDNMDNSVSDSAEVIEQRNDLMK